MKIIDFHTHIYPEPLADKATKTVRNFYGLDDGSIHATADVLCQIGKTCDIEKFVVLPVALKPAHVRTVNQAIVDEAAKHGEFIGFGTVHADMENITDELEFIEKSGLCGIKIHPDTQLFNIDDRRLFDMYDYIRTRMPIVIHTGDPRYDFSHPRRVKHILKEFPGITVIAAHLGGWGMYSEGFEILKNENCFVDISSSARFMAPGDDICKYINGYGADRIVFGSDFPLWSPKEEVENFYRLPISDADKEKIAYKNALRILKKG